MDKERVKKEPLIVSKWTLWESEGGVPCRRI